MRVPFFKMIELVAEPFVMSVRAGGLVTESGIPGGIVVVIKETQTAI